MKMKKISKKPKHKIIKIEKKAIKAFRTTAGKVKMQDGSKNVDKVMEKTREMTKKGKTLLAEAVAGVTLLAGLGAYSVYLVKHPGKKADRNNIKMGILKEIHQVTEQVKKMTKK